MSAREQTWDVLEEALASIRYTRDEIAEWRQRRFELHRDDANNYAVLYIFTHNGWDPYTTWFDGHPDEQAKAPGDD